MKDATARDGVHRRTRRGPTLSSKSMYRRDCRTPYTYTHLPVLRDEQDSTDYTNHHTHTSIYTHLPDVDKAQGLCRLSNARHYGPH